MPASNTCSNHCRDRRPRSGRIIAAWGMPLLLAGAGVAVYANSLRGVFLFDDIQHIVDNPAIRHLWPLADLVRANPSRPLLSISLAVNYALGGLHVTGYHAFNIAVHVAAGLTLFGLVRRTLRVPALAHRYADAADELACAIALLWLVHPLTTQAVTYVVQRCEALMGLFFLLTMYVYLRGATASTPTRSRTWYGLSLLTYVLGLGSKEVMVTVVPVLWLYDRCFLATSWRESVRRRGWLHLAFLGPLAGAATLLVPGMLARQSTAGFGVAAVSPWEYARSQPGVLLHYLRLAFGPYPQCLDHGWPIENRWLWGILVPGVSVLGLAGLSVWALRRGWRMGFLGVTFLLILAPTSSIIPIQDLCVEHRMYLPLVCVLAAIVLSVSAILEFLPRKQRRWCGLLATFGATAALGGLTVARNAAYHDAVAMWSDVVRQVGGHSAGGNLARPLNNLGRELLQVGRFEEGVRVLERALELGVSSPDLHSNLGQGLLQLGDLERARSHVEEALREQPHKGRFHQQLGLVAARQRRLAEAELHLREAARLLPHDATVHTNLGQCLLEQGQTAEALRCLQIALELDPSAVETRRRLVTALVAAERWEPALALVREWASVAHQDASPELFWGQIEAQRGNDDAALQHFRCALRREPDSAEAHYRMGNALRRRGDVAGAVQSYERAVARDGTLAEAHNNLAGLLVAREPRRAARHFQAAVAARPDFIEARCNWAATLVRLGQSAEAAEQFRQVLRRRPDFVPAREQLQALITARTSAAR